jgi:hypothetical protein
MTGQAASLPTGIQVTAAIVPGHYASEEQVARALARLGKPAAAALIQGKLPTTKAIRSGDLGEIYATEWIDAHSGGYRAPIKRLRWKDHRNMAMRGDVVIGILQDAQTQRLQFLKTEAKSRATLTAQVLTEARAGLDKDGGLPSAHALSFISARLLELGNLPLNGRRETLTIGRYGPSGISLAMAREKLLDAKKAVAQGKSPAHEKQREKRRLTAAKNFGDMTAQWMAGARMADSTRAMRKSIVDRDILPAFQNRLLNEITADDLRALCGKVKGRGAPATAVHIRDIVK